MANWFVHLWNEARFRHESLLICAIQRLTGTGAFLPSPDSLLSFSHTAQRGLVSAPWPLTLGRDPSAGTQHLPSSPQQSGEAVRVTPTLQRRKQGLQAVITSPSPARTPESQAPGSVHDRLHGVCFRGSGWGWALWMEGMGGAPWPPGVAAHREPGLQASV